MGILCKLAGHRWRILGSRLQCKRCFSVYTPEEQDVIIYPKMYAKGETCDVHKWEITRQVLVLGKGYVQDVLCKNCGAVKRDLSLSHTVMLDE